MLTPLCNSFILKKDILNPNHQLALYLLTDSFLPDFKSPQTCFPMRDARLPVSRVWVCPSEQNSTVGLATAALLVSRLDSHSLQFTICCSILVHIIKEIHCCHFNPHGAVKGWIFLSNWKGQSFLIIFYSQTRCVPSRRGPSGQDSHASYAPAQSRAQWGQPGWLTLDKCQQLTGHTFYLDPHSRLRQVCQLQLRYNFPFSYRVFSPRFASAEPSSPPGFCWNLPSPPPSNLPCMSLCHGPQGSQGSWLCFSFSLVLLGDLSQALNNVNAYTICVLMSGDEI